jgi:hypothetical protein
VTKVIRWFLSRRVVNLREILGNVRGTATILRLAGANFSICAGRSSFLDPGAILEHWQNRRAKKLTVDVEARLRGERDGV